MDLTDLQGRRNGYGIKGKETQMLEVTLAPGARIVARPHALNHMDPGICLITPVKGSQIPEDGRPEAEHPPAIPTRHFFNPSRRRRQVAFSGGMAGPVIALSMGEFPNQTLICRDRAFICAEPETDMDLAFFKTLSTAGSGEEPFVLLKLQGEGRVFLQGGGTVVVKELEDQSLQVEAGALVAMTSKIRYTLAAEPEEDRHGGDAGAMVTLRGRGRVWLQSLSFTPAAPPPPRPEPPRFRLKNPLALLRSLFKG